MSVYVLVPGTLVNPYGPPKQTISALMTGKGEHTEIVKTGLFAVPIQFCPVGMLEVRVVKGPHRLQYVDKSKGKHLCYIAVDEWLRLHQQASVIKD